jgi:hypothetical protein
LAALVVLAAVATGPGNAASSQEHAAGEVVEATPLVATVLARPQPVLGADNRIHLPYELLVMNLSPLTVQIDAIDTLDVGQQGAVLATLAGPALTGAIKSFASTNGTAVGPSQVSRVFMDLTAAPSASLPQRIAHRFTLTATPPNGTAANLSEVSGWTDVGQQAAVVLDPPLAGSRWVAGGGCCLPPTPHRLATLPLNGAIYVPERFAIDFVQLNAAGQIFSGPLNELSSFAFFGAPVYSAADGVVVGAVDGLPEQVPGSVSPDIGPQTAGGNYVVTDIGNGRFAFYAHLQPGSLRVRVGDTVTRGQVLGLLGNSGNSDVPHLHFHVMDGPEPLLSNGLPFVFRSFDSEGRITDDLEDIVEGRPLTIDRALVGPHQNQLPLDNQIVNFPSPRASARGPETATLTAR